MKVNDMIKSIQISIFDQTSCQHTRKCRCNVGHFSENIESNLIRKSD